MREWVVGFLIDIKFNDVVLINKTKPPWMAGMLNGVGGKVEPDEAPVDAMWREFEEETDLLVHGWEPFVRMTAVSTEDRSGHITSEQGVIHFYRAFVNDLHTLGIRSMTEEPVGFYYIPDVVNGAERTVPNLRWLLPLALHTHDTYEVIDVVERSTTLRVEVPQ